MKCHEILSDAVRRVTYENGDTMLIDYGSGTAFLNDRQILPITEAES